MFKIYANFTDQEINNSIFEKYGLKTNDKRHVTLNRCPRCNNVLKPDNKFCSICALALDQATANVVETIKSDYMQFSDLEEIREMKNALKQELEEISKLKEMILKAGK